MIFVTVGSQKFQFDRLLKAVDDLVADGTIQETVFAQSGVSAYVPKNYTSKAFLDRQEFLVLMEQAHIVITHGGAGSIISALRAGKKVIAVPRLEKFGEHVDDHQLQIVEEFSKDASISYCLEPNEIGNLLKAKNSKMDYSYRSNTKAYLESISNFIETIL